MESVLEPQDSSPVLTWILASRKEIERAADVDIQRGKKEYPLLVFSQMVYSHLVC